MKRKFLIKKRKGAPEPRPLPRPPRRGTTERHLTRRSHTGSAVQAMLLLFESPRAQVRGFSGSSYLTLVC